MVRIGQLRCHHIAERLWLVEAPSCAWFEVWGEWIVLDADKNVFPSRAEACRAYREGYTPNVTYPD